MAVVNFSPLLGLALPTTGDLAGTWGNVVNDSITGLLDSAVAGTTTLTADADVTLSTTTGAANQARNAVILWTAAGSVTRNITAPAQSKAYVVINATGGSQSIVIRGAGPTTGVTISAAEKALVAWNGSDFVKISSSNVDGVATINFGSTGLTPNTPTSGAVTVAGTLTAANGGTGQNSYTTGDLLYSSGSTTLSKLGVGASNTVLTSSGSAPQWSTSLTLAGSLTVDSTTDSTSTTTGSIQTDGGIGVVKSVYVGGTLTIDSTTDSSSTTTGSLQTDGGAGIVKNLYVGGNALIGTATNTNSSSIVANGTISETVGGTQYLVASQYDIGTDPNQIPLNQHLGNLAYQDAGSIAGNVVIGGTVTSAGITSTGPSVISVNSTSDALRITQIGTGNALVVEDSANPDATPFVVDAGGNVIIGTSNPSSTAYSLYVESASGVLTSTGSNTAATSPTIGTSRRRTGLASVVSGDSLGKFSGFGWDATSFVEATRIESAVDGTPGTNDMPGRLVFSTTADGASTPTERLRIDSSGNVGIGTSSPNVKLQVDGGSTSGTIGQFGNAQGGVILGAASSVAYVNTTSSSPLAFQTNGTERARIDSSGIFQFKYATQETKTAIAASAIDLSAGNYFSKTISGSTTFTVSNTATSGLVSAFVLDLTNGGSATVTWWSGVKWNAATPPTLTASGRDVLGFFTYDGGTTWNGFVLGQAMA